MNLKNFHLAQYIIELSLIDSSFLTYQPSLLGCAAFYLVNKVRKIADPWPLKVVDLTGYNERDLQHCAKNLLGAYENATSVDSTEMIRKKFAQNTFSEVAHLKLERRR